MIEIDIQSDIKAAIRDVGDFFRREIPYVVTETVNSVALDVQRKLRDSTIPGSWTVRDKQLSRSMTTLIPDESGQGGLLKRGSIGKGKRSIVIGPARSKVNGYLAGEGFAERNVTGAKKMPKNQHVAIPRIGPGLRRKANGRIADNKKPKNIIGKNSKFVHIKAGSNNDLARYGADVIYERMAKGKLRLRYTMPKSAKGTKQLAGFYPEAYATVNRVFSGHFRSQTARAVKTSRFS